MRRVFAFQSLLHLIAFLALAIATSSDVAARQCGSNWALGPDGQVPGVDGWVQAQAVWDPDGDGPSKPVLVVGGTIFGTWDGSNWKMSTGDPGLEADVRSMIVFNGNLVVGSSSRVTSRTGTQTVQLGGVFNGEISELAIYNGELIAAGSFARINNVLVGHVVRWDGVAWQPIGPGIIGQNVRALTVYDGKLIAGGQFTAAGGVPALNIAQWDGATWQPLGAGMVNGWGGDPGVHSLVQYGSDLIAGGVFTQAGAVSANNIARWNGVSWSAMGSGTSTPLPNAPDVMSLLPFKGDLYAAGTFTAMNGLPVQSIARWNGSTWTSVGSGPLAWSGRSIAVLNSLAEYEGKLFAGGFFYSAQGQPAFNIASWNSSSWELLGSGLSAPISVNPNVYSFTPYRDELFVTGVFTTAGKKIANNIASWNGVDWNSVGAGANGPVYTSIEYQGNLVAGGQFGTLGGTSAACIGRWDGTAWSPMGSGLTAPANSTPYAYALVLLNTDLIVAGNFTQAGGTTVNHIARWDGAAWHPMGSGFNGPVFSLTMYNGDLIAAGFFTKSGTVTMNRVARWDGVAWQPLGSGLSGTVNSVTVFRGELVVGGAFFITEQGVTCRAVARWDGALWRPLGTGLTLASGFASVNALTVFQDRLIAGGSFTSPGQNIASWDGTTWTNSAGLFDNTVTSFGQYKGELQIGGKFTFLNYYSQSCYRARLSGHQLPWIGIHPKSSSVNESDTLLLSSTPATGYRSVTYQWMRNGVAVSNGPGGASPGGGLVSGANGVFDSPTRGLPAELKIENSRPSDAGDYTLVVTSNCGSDTSRPASVAIAAACKADLNGDSFVDDSDFSTFAVAYDILDCTDPSMPLGCPADLNADTAVDDADFTVFLAAYTALVCG